MPACAAPLRGVLFDAAGTLIAPREPVGATYARMARGFGVEISGWRLNDAFRRMLAQAPPMVFPGRTIAEVEALERAWWRELVRGSFHAADSALAARFYELDACFEALFAHYADARAWTAVAGSHALLRSLRARGLATGVVSNFDRRLHGILDGLELTGLLDVVALPSDAGAAKPDVAIFEWALRRLDLAASQALFVGDDVREDVEGARAAGLRAVHLKSPAKLALVEQEVERFAP